MKTYWWQLPAWIRRPKLLWWRFLRIFNIGVVDISEVRGEDILSVEDSTTVPHRTINGGCEEGHSKYGKVVIGGTVKGSLIPSSPDTVPFSSRVQEQLDE